MLVNCFQLKNSNGPTVCLTTIIHFKTNTPMGAQMGASVGMEVDEKMTTVTV